MAKLKLELTDLKVESFDSMPHDEPRQGTVFGLGSTWGLSTCNDSCGDSCQVFCSYNNQSCYGSCDTVCIDCETAGGCGQTGAWTCDGSTCASTCVNSCNGTCNCTVADTCPCI
jgi:hypothetical protein